MYARAVIARFATLLVVLLLTAPAVAVAQNPFTPLPQSGGQQPTVTVDTNADPLADEDDGLGETTQLLIGISGFVLLLGIAWAIIRDARSVAPVTEHERDLADDPDRRKGSQVPKKQQVARQRAAAKRARQQRKKNR